MCRLIDKYDVVFLPLQSVQVSILSAVHKLDGGAIDESENLTCTVILRYA
jgi:hypothetical protein